MRRSLASGTIALILALSGDALACQFDTDCKPGSKCLKPSGQINGVCAGGLQPGNKNDRKPSGSVYGTCMR